MLLLLICFVPANAPKKWFGGTFIGAIVVEDGVVIGSDTRSTFIDDSGKQFGYIDGIPKLFVQHGSALAISGLSSVSGELFSSFVNRNEYLLERPVNEILFGVMLGLPFRNSSKVLLISAGFENGRPMICAKNPNDPQVCRSGGFITNRESLSLTQWLTSARGAPQKAIDASIALRQAIQESADQDSTVGGMISVVHLRENAPPEWLDSVPGDHGWKTVCDIISDYKRGKVKIAFTHSKDELDRNLNVTCVK
jgi:hypothetical protein